ncbi:MAG: T9SS type A sorting domain-containing protein [Bacteroidales bacterium]|nr:T9SS type A sorting domain-containing protein [Bacteroidales bacterium]
MKKKFTIVLLLFISVVLMGQEYKWVKNYGNFTSENASAITHDIMGSLFITGFTEWDLTIEGFYMNDPGVYIAKFDTTGQFQWAIGSTGFSWYTQASGIVCDEDNNVIVTGYYSNEITFGDIELQYTSQPRIFIVKYSNGGQLLWAKSYGATDNYSTSFANDITVDNQNNIYITGDFETTLVFDTILLVSNNSTSWDYFDTFVAKFNNLGEVVWANRGGGTYDDYAYSVELDRDNHVYMAGMYQPHDSDFGDTLINLNNSSRRGFLAKYDTDGAFMWLRSDNIGDNSLSEWIEIACDSANCVYTFGYLVGSLIVNHDSLIDTEIILTKRDQLGNDIFGRGIKSNFFPTDYYMPGTWHHKLGGMVIDQSQNVIITSNFVGELIFANDTLVSTISRDWNSVDPCILKFNSIGYPQWAIQGGGAWWDYAFGITCEVSNIYTCGTFSSLEAVFGNDTVYNYSDNDEDDFFFNAIRDTTNNICPTGITTISSQQPYFCAGDSAVIICESEYGSVYQWMHENTVLSYQYSNEFWVNDSITVYAIVNPHTVCADTSDVIKLEILSKPLAELAALPENSMCPGDSIILQATLNQYNTIQWFKNDSLLMVTDSMHLIVSEPGNYHIIVSNGYCSNSNSIEVFFKEKPNAHINSYPGNVLCPESSIELSVEHSPDYQYYWYYNSSPIGGNENTVTIYSPGNYQINVIGISCQDMDSIEIVSKQYPVLDLSEDTLFTNQFPVIFDAGPSDDQYRWYYKGSPYPISYQSTVEITQYGVYYVYLSNICNISIDSLEVLNPSSGINELNMEKLGLFPNPANDIITLSTPDGESIYQIIIYNETGQILYENKPVSNTISLKGIQSGSHIIVVKTKTKTYRELLLIQ